MIAGVRAIYDAVFEAARKQRRRGQAMLATGHCYMTSTRLSELSERRILGGNQHALPVDIFPDDCAYAALGHLHLAQPVERSERVRYCGSPIPLSMAEAAYEHQVIMADFEDAELSRAIELHVPRHVELLRVPEQGPGSLDEVVSAIAALPPGKGHEDEAERWPYLEVRVRLDAPDPGLRARVDAIVASRAVRLLRIAVEYSGQGGTFADWTTRRPLADIRPERVFGDCWERRYGAPPAEGIRSAFAELLESVQERDPAARPRPAEERPEGQT
jgi:exonuclease SbcD